MDRFEGLLAFFVLTGILAPIQVFLQTARLKPKTGDELTSFFKLLKHRKTNPTMNLTVAGIRIPLVFL